MLQGSPHPAPTVAYRAILAAIACAFSVTAIVAASDSAAGIVLAAAAALPIVAWAVNPAVPPGVVVLGTGACVIGAFAAGSSEPLLFLVSVSAVIAGASERSIPRLAALGVFAASVPVIVELAYPDGRLAVVWIAGIVLPLALGRAAQMQLDLATELASAREELALNAIAAERRQIARDVHDLVGHGLTAVLIQVTGARHILRRDVDAADEALADAETLGRRSLNELRATLSLLRGANESGTPPPLPIAADIERAVAQARQVGLDASFTVSGDVERVDPVVGLSLHRVVEEALANARRHASAARTSVVLEVADDDVSVTIESIGPLGPPNPVEAGRPRFGLIGMSERMAAVGGVIDVGPTATGWSVCGRAPLTPLVPADPR